MQRLYKLNTTSLVFARLTRQSHAERTTLTNESLNGGLEIPHWRFE